MPTRRHVLNQAGRGSEVLQWVLPQDPSDQTIRPDVIGRQLQVFLYGLCLGVSVLSPALASSSRAVKTFLYFIMLLNTFYTVLRAEHLTVLSASQQRSAGSLSNYSSLPDALVVVPYLVMTISVQIFLAIRVVKTLPTRVAKMAWLMVFVLALTAAIFFWAVGAIADEILWFLNAQHNSFLEGYGVAIYLGLTAFIDVLIAVTLGALLYRKIVGFNKRTDSALRRILRVTLATGAFTSTIALIAAIVTSTTFGEDATFQIFEDPLPPLYCLSVFWTLDLRSRLRDKQRQNNLQLSLGLLTAGPLPGIMEGASRPNLPAITEEPLQVSLGAPFETTLPQNLKMTGP